MTSDSIYISSNDKTPPRKKANEQDDMKTNYILKAPADGHCFIHCFGEQFNEGAIFILEHLWYKISNSSHIYREFSKYLSTDKL